ncbi:MAG: tetratricopeptide repeat protein [Bryobacterales bacterium]|nr:tetratricopeptide repeat protein [Bryobacterales bacterium]
MASPARWLVAILWPLAAADYAPPESCAPCHQEIAARYAATAMSRSLYALTPATAGADFREPQSFYHASSDRHYAMERRGGRFFMRRWQDEDGRRINEIEREVHYVLGSGNHARSYLHRAADGRLVQLPLAWYADKGGFWAMAPGYDRPVHADFRRPVDYECLTCHNGYTPELFGQDATERGVRIQGRLTEGIDCQRCHGPGAKHVEAARRGAPAKALIVQPASLGRDRQIEVCMQCHLETTSRPLPHKLIRPGRGVMSYRPGEPMRDWALHFDHAPGTPEQEKFEVVSAVYRLRKSACFTASGTMTCTTCHDPHEPASQGRYDAACSSCHTRFLERTPMHARTGCAGCHMPLRRTEDAVHVLLTDHFIHRDPAARDWRATLSASLEGEGRPYQGEVALHYPPPDALRPEDELLLAAAQVKEQTNLAAGIARLERALRRFPDAAKEFRFELGEALRHAGRLDAAARAYGEASLSQAWRGLGLVESARGQPQAAVAAFARAIAADPLDATAWNGQGEALLRLGRPADAAAALRRAIAANPDLPEPHHNLAAALAAAGDAAGARHSALEAMTLRPDFAAPHALLASLSQGPEGLRYARRAVALDPRDAGAHDVLALNLAQSDQFADARRHWEESLRLAPDRAAVHNNFATLLVRMGDRVRALHHYRRAVALDPGFAPARFNLAVTLAEAGQTAAARAEADSLLRGHPDYPGARALRDKLRQ